MVAGQVDWTFYLVTDQRWLGGRTLWDSVEAAIRGGATVVQLREKEIPSRDYLDLARRVKAVTDRAEVPLIIDDRLDIALAVDADGVHVGPEDLPVAAVRRLLGPDRIVGASACTLEEALRFQDEGADYLGVGAVFPTATKGGTESVSLEQLRRIKAAVRIPVVGIGGITADNAPAVMETGVDGVAVVSAVMAQPDIGEAALRLSALLKKGAGR
ncbi:MAG: thiamine phosphate synthase [Deltaproteobacteria bacterium]|nr:thiamine phosphate synthase [Deltaproteobacteria bacterium]